MPNDFQMEIKIKMNAVVSNGGNIIHVTEIKIRNCTDQPNMKCIKSKISLLRDFQAR
jgi:hypothetical protein